MSTQLGFSFEAGEDQSAIHGDGDLTARPERTHRQRSPHSDRRLSQLALSLEHKIGAETETSIRGQVRLEMALRSMLGPRVLVSLTTNRSTMISYRTRRGVLYVRAHAIFADAPYEVIRALATFVSGSQASAREARLIDDFIELHRHHIRGSPAKPLIVQPLGEFHDLRTMLDRLNDTFFEKKIRAAITWSRAPRQKRRNSIRMGSYCDEQCLIRIHPALDQSFVPDYFVESVVFHEMLHEHYGVDETKDGRRCVHPREFLDHERRFPSYQDARRWERKHLSKLLRY